MITDFSKVIKVPKEISSDASLEYICGCTTCLSRIQSLSAEQSYVHEALNRVEQALQSTPFMSKNISLQLMNSRQEFHSISLEQINEYVIRMFSTDIAFTQALLAYVKFTHQFNKKYRQHLICFMHDSNIKLLENSRHISNSAQYPQLLAKYNGQLAFLRDQQDILHDIASEQFISPRILAPLLNKTQRAIVETKFYAGQVIERHYTSMTQNDLPHNLIVVKATHKMA